MEDITKGVQQLQLLTPKDISEEFNKLQVIVLDYEETCGDQSKSTFEQTITRLQTVQQAIINQSLFSPNEEFKEILTENLKYLLLPFYIGDVFIRMTENRKKNLEFSKVYLSEFLKLVDHYGLVEEKTREMWKNQEEQERYEPTREEKIAQFRQQKELETKLKNLDLIKDENVQRDAVETQCKILIIRAIDSLKSMKMEFEILAYREKIQNDQEAKEQHDGLMKKPLPKLKYWNIPKPDQQQNQDLPYLLNQAQAQGQGGHAHLCEPCLGQTREEIKHQKKQEVWRPDISQPSVRLEELGDMYMRDMAIMEEQKKEREREEEYRKENIDSDGEETVELKRLEQSAWDDWKDENEKGAGNRMGK